MPRKAKDEALTTMDESIFTTFTTENTEDVPASDLSSDNTPTSPEELAKARKKTFYGLDFRKLDKDLSFREQEEWDAIYASYRAGSMLTGVVAGIDAVDIDGEAVDCLVVIDYRVKVIIPPSEIWTADAPEKSAYILHRYMGAQIDYIVTNVDRAAGLVMASRKLALRHHQRRFERKPPSANDIIDCRILAVSETRLLLEYSGFEIVLPARSITYGTVMDLREDYHAGETVQAVFKEYSDGKVWLSIKEVNPHPFEGSDQRHPKGARRLCRIVGKRAGGLFCELEKDLTCRCVYSVLQNDKDYDLGDKVVVIITHFDYANRLVYGKIVTGW